MPDIHEELSAQFTAFARRGCGWKVHDAPVALEPGFVPFNGYSLRPVVDDGRIPTVGSSLLSGLARWLAPGSVAPPLEVKPRDETESDPEPCFASRSDDLVELRTILPAKLDIDAQWIAAFLGQLRMCSQPVAFEVVGTAGEIAVQFVVDRCDVPSVSRQLAAFFPEVGFVEEAGSLARVWEGIGGEVAVVEFGLDREFLFPLQNGSKVDLFVGLLGAMGGLSRGEGAVFQVLFQAAESNWSGSAWKAVVGAEGKPIFTNRPDLTIHTKAKFSAPLFAVVVRVASRAESFDRAWGIAREMAFSLRTFAAPDGNSLVPLRNDEYDEIDHADDVIYRQSRRSGMLLNVAELMGFVHFPSNAVRSAGLRPERGRTKAAPSALQSPGLVLGINEHFGKKVEVSLSSDARTRHMHVIGASGTGKSNFLLNLIQQDIENGEGLAVLDPHGDLIDRILGLIPPERIDDVVLVDPSDETASIGFNVLSAHSDLEKTLLASDLVSVFQRLSTSWGDQMGSVLNNAILAFLESSEGGTLADLRRFLLEPAYRERFLRTVNDPDILYYWRKGFAQLTGNKSVGPILTRLETFLSPKPIRYMVSQRRNRLDFAHILDSGKIFLAKLSQGQIGNENSFLLGSLLVAKFQQTVMARQRQAATSRRDFWLYVDEFHNFITPSMAEILSGARKYRLGLVLAHQELRQLERDREVAGAVLSNPYTRVIFRVGDADARSLEKGLSSFDARDLQNLETGRAVCRIEKADGDFNLEISLSEEPNRADALALRDEVIRRSRDRYATPRHEIESELRARFEEDCGRAEPLPPEPRSKPRPQTPGPTSSPSPPPAAAPKSEASSPKDPPRPSTAPPVPPSAPIDPEPPRSDETEHVALRRHITEAAERLGYHVTAEEAVPGTGGRADIVLRRGKRVVACEISITTNADEEIHNLTKCLSGGYPLVVLVAPSARKLSNIEKKFRALPVADDARVQFLVADDFIEKLREWASTDPREIASESEHQPKRQTFFGGSSMSADDRREREREMLDRLAHAMKNDPKGK